MNSSKNKNLVYNLKLSTVGPARVTGPDVAHEPNGLDLATKLHYLKAVYFFSSQASQEITLYQLKEAFFLWLNDYYRIAGRFRRNDDGRPYVKCNDCGARFIEAKCDLSLDEWLELKDCALDQDLLVYHLPIGPELFFSPSVYIQVTNFKCGGLSLGLSWAHVHGDPFSFTESMNTWAKFLARLKSYGPLKIPKPSLKLEKSQSTTDPLSLKQVDPVGDHWVTPNEHKMETFSLFLTASQVSHLPSKIRTPNKNDLQIPFFEVLCALMWQMMAKIRDGPGPRVVTLLKNGPKQSPDTLSNNQVISSVKAGFPVIDSDLEKLALLLVDGATDETRQIEEVVEKDNGVSDYIVYGVNLTFANFEGADLYGLELDGYKPERVHYTIQGVGDEGALLVLPWPKDCGENGEIGRIVMITLPENEVVKLKEELKKHALLVDGELE